LKKLLIGLFALIGLFFMGSVSSASAAVAKAGPYEGVFHGIVQAPDGSEAAMSLDLTHRGSMVEGTVSLGEGLTIDAGMCGEAAIPAANILASGKTSTLDNKKLSAVSNFDVSGVAVKVILDSAINKDTIDATAKIDLPWLCGSDPVLTGKLHRE